MLDDEQAIDQFQELKIKSSKICNVKLNFQSVNVIPNKHKYSISCKTIDGFDVVCSWDADFVHNKTEHLQTNDQIEIKNVSVQFSKRQNDLILTRKSAIYLHGAFGTVPILCKTKPIQRVELDDLKNILDCPTFPKCTITLKVNSYSVKKKRICLECSTADNKQITITTNSRRHDKETILMKNDLVKFVDIVFVKSENDNILFKFDENTRVFLFLTNGKMLDIPKEILTYSKFQSAGKVILEKEKKDFICPICFEDFWIRNDQVLCTPFELAQNNGRTETHRICKNCIKQLAKSALTDAPLAFNGIGLPCCVPKCGNVFLMSEFENYLDEKVRRVLMSRMQRESVLAANMDDLVICPDCSAMNIVDPCEIHYDCVCGTRRCRNCPRIYDKIHSENTCKQLDSRNNVELELSKVVVRQCPRCHLQFVKSDGCNTMICRCGKVQCYLCRALITDNRSHFCSCGFKFNDGPCTWCNKICVLHCDADEYDKRQLEKIKKENGYKDYGPTSKSLFLKIFVAFFLVFFFIVLFKKFAPTLRIPFEK